VVCWFGVAAAEVSPTGLACVIMGADDDLGESSSLTAGVTNKMTPITKINSPIYCFI